MATVMCVGTVEETAPGSFRVAGWMFDFRGDDDTPWLEVSERSVSGVLVAGFTPEELEAIAESGYEPGIG